MPKLNTYSDNGAYVNTTDATATTLATFLTKSDKAYMVEADIGALNTTSFGAAAFFSLRAAFLNDGGTLARVGGVQAIAASLGVGGVLNNATASLAAVGNEIVASVVGVAATNLTWNINARIQEYNQYISEGGLIG